MFDVVPGGMSCSKTEGNPFQSDMIKDFLQFYLAYFIKLKDFCLIF